MAGAAVAGGVQGTQARRPARTGTD